MAKSLEQKQDETAERNKLRAQRTPEEQLARLDHILGKATGAKKERAKLAKLIANRKEQR